MHYVTTGPVGPGLVTLCSPNRGVPLQCCRLSSPPYAECVSPGCSTSTSDPLTSLLNASASVSIGGKVS